MTKVTAAGDLHPMNVWRAAPIIVEAGSGAGSIVMRIKPEWLVCCKVRKYLSPWRCAMLILKYVCYVLLVVGVGFFGAVNELGKMLPPEITQQMSEDARINAEQQARYERTKSLNDLPTCPNMRGLMDLQRFTQEHSVALWMWGFIYSGATVALLGVGEAVLRSMRGKGTSSA